MTQTSSSNKIDAAARLLMDQHLKGEPFSDLPTELVPTALYGAEGAYAVQDALVSLRETEFETDIAGYKIALSSKTMQALCGIDEPIAGVVLSNVVRKTNAVMAMDEHIHAGVEFELCVILGEDLPASEAPFDCASVGLAVKDCIPCFEIIEDRGADYEELNANMLAADNAWNDAVVMGKNSGDWHRLDLSSAPVRLLIDGQVDEESDTGAAMGHPFEAVAWIANSLAKRGQSLKAGQFVITGSTMKTRFPEAGLSLRYEIEGLGAVDMLTVRSAAHCADRGDPSAA